MAATSNVGWYPTDPNFRKRFEVAIVDGLRHFVKYGDITGGQRLLDSTDDKGTRYAITKSITDQSPVHVGKNGKPAGDKARVDGFD